MNDLDEDITSHIEELFRRIHLLESLKGGMLTVEDAHAAGARAAAVLREIESLQRVARAIQVALHQARCRRGE